jgi:hypothetical protein
MSRITEYSIRGVRTFYKEKGCHSCEDCKNLVHRDKVLCCSVREKSCLNDRKFPYDNTKCKEFVQNEQ